jgi:hypothetical protein
MLERLLGKDEHPAGHRDRYPVGARSRTSGYIILGACPERKSRRAAQDLVLLLESLGTLTQLSVLRLEIAVRLAGANGTTVGGRAVLSVGDLQPEGQTRFGETELRAT